MLVIDKPAGLVVHPGAACATGTLVHALLHHDPADRRRRRRGRPGIVHRLDKDTSGLHGGGARPSAPTACWSRRSGARESDAALPGAGLGRSRAGDRARSRPRSDAIRAIASAWRWCRGAASRRAPAGEVLERFGLAAVLELRLETGRTHQIRVHLAHLGHPVVGRSALRWAGEKAVEPRRSRA